MTPEDLLTDDIIKACLLKDRGPSANLLKWSQECCSKAGEIFFNVVNRIRISFTQDGVEKETSYVAKLNPCKPDDTFNPYRHRAVAKEVFFYTELLPLLNAELNAIGEPPLSVPKCFHGSNEKEKEVIVFEDLALLGYKIFDKALKMDGPHSEIMAKEIARLHASSFLLKKKYPSKHLSEVFPLLVESWMVEDEPELSVGFSEIFIKGVEQNVDIVAALQTHDELISSLQNLSSHALDLLKRHLKDSPEWDSICHGDYHRTNVLFRYDRDNNPAQVMVLDWQTVRMASIGSELSYLAFSSIFNPDRSNLMAHVERTYFSNISRLLGSHLTFSLSSLENCVSSNHFGLLLCFYLIPMSLCMSDPSEFFLIKQKTGELKENVVDRERGLNFLKDNTRLKNVITDYLEEIIKRNLDVVFRQL